MNETLEQLLRTNRHVWRGHGDMAVRKCGFATGYAELDAILPEGGWPRGALVELTVPQWGIGELQLLLPAMIAASQNGRRLVWISPPYIPYAPALSGSGIPLNRLLLLQPEQQESIPWAMEKVLSQRDGAMVLAWPGKLKPVTIRRLQLAAEAGGSLGILLHDRDRGASPAALRMRLAPNDTGLQISILKSRAACRRQTINLALV